MQSLREQARPAGVRERAGGRLSLSVGRMTDGTEGKRSRRLGGILVARPGRDCRLRAPPRLRPVPGRRPRSPPDPSRSSPRAAATPLVRSGLTPAATRAAAALSVTMSRWARVAGEHRRGDGGVGGGVAAARSVVRPVEPELGRVDLVLRTRRRSSSHTVDVIGGRELVHAVVAVDHHGPGRAPLLQHADDGGGHGRVVHPDHLARHPGRVGERADEVEQRRDAELGPHRTGVAHGRVEGAGEAEAHAGLGHAGGHARAVEVDADAERFEQVERAAGRAGLAVAVLAHRRARPRRPRSRPWWTR